MTLAVCWLLLCHSPLYLLLPCHVPSCLLPSTLAALSVASSCCLICRHACQSYLADLLHCNLSLAACWLQSCHLASCHLPPCLLPFAAYNLVAFHLIACPLLPAALPPVALHTTTCSLVICRVNGLPPCCTSVSLSLPYAASVLPFEALLFTAGFLATCGLGLAGFFAFPFFAQSLAGLPSSSCRLSPLPALGGHLAALRLAAFSSFRFAIAAGILAVYGFPP